MQGIKAVTPVSLCVFARDGLRDLVREYQSLGYDITWLCAREEEFVDENLLTAWPYDLATKDEDGWFGSIEFPINHQHIADTLGLSLAHKKTLRRLHKLGLHELENARLRLRNTRALEHIADYYDAPARRVPLLWKTENKKTKNRRRQGPGAASILKLCS